MREAEEQEAQDEEEGLIDQTMPAKPALPGLPGIVANGAPSNDPIGIMPAVPENPLALGGAPPPLPPNFTGMDPHRFAQLVAQGKIPVPPPPMHGSGAIPPPPPNFDFSKIPPEILARFPGGIPPPLPPMGSAIGGPPPIGLPSVEDLSAGSGPGSIRKRAPLPSQQESLKEEQRRGNFRTAR